MPDDKPLLTAGQKAAQTKGKKGLKRAAKKAASTKAIQKAVATARKQLAAIAAKVAQLGESLDKIDRSTGDGKR